MSEKELLDKVLDALSKRLGVDKAKLIEVLVKSYIEERNRYKSIKDLGDFAERRFLKSDMTLDDIFKYNLMRKMLGEEDINLNKVLALAAIRQLFQPDPTMIMLIERMSTSGSKGGSDDKWLQFFIQQQQQQQQLMMQMMQILFGKRYEEMMNEFMGQVQSQQEQIRKEFDEKLRQLANSMANDIKELKRDRSELARYLAELKDAIQRQPQGADLLIQMINQYKALKDAILSAAEAFGIKKEEVPIKPSGEVDWGALLNRLFELAGKYLEVKREVELAKTGRQPTPPPPTQAPSETPPGFQPIEKPEEAREEAVGEAKKEEVLQPKELSEAVMVKPKEESEEK